MRRRHVDVDALLNMMHEQKVVTKEEMMELLGCSSMTLWRVLSEYGYLTSYNFNARYYVLSDIPKFNDNGLWFHNGIGFSVHGSLTETLRTLAAHSEVGFTCLQLQQQLGVNVGPTLRKLCQAGDLFRQKHEGVFVYFASEENRQRAQLVERCARKITLPVAPPPVKAVVAILVELIQRVELTPTEISSRLSRRGLTVTEDEVRKVFEHYDLQPVKKGLSDC